MGFGWERKLVGWESMKAAECKKKARRRRPVLPAALAVTHFCTIGTSNAERKRWNAILLTYYSHLPEKIAAEACAPNHLRRLGEWL